MPRAVSAVRHRLTTLGSLTSHRSVGAPREPDLHSRPRYDLPPAGEPALPPAHTGQSVGRVASLSSRLSIPPRVYRLRFGHKLAFHWEAGRGPRAKFLTRCGPALYAAAAKPKFPNWSRSSRSQRADSLRDSAGSNGSDNPRQRAVPGINWAMPCAPARLTAFGSKLLSWRINRIKKSMGRP
jgi:hypothetical protein